MRQDRIKANQRKHFAVCFSLLENFYFIFSIIGENLASLFVQTGTLFSVINTTDSRISGKFKNHFRELEKKN